MTPFENLVRLQTLFALWPNDRGRAEFKTDLHLKSALSDAYDEVFPPQGSMEERQKALSDAYIGVMVREDSHKWPEKKV